MSNSATIAHFYASTIKEWNYLPSEIIEQVDLFADKLLHYYRLTT